MTLAQASLVWPPSGGAVTLQVRFKCSETETLMVQRETSNPGLGPPPQNGAAAKNTSRGMSPHLWALPPELCRHGRVPWSLRFLPQGLAERIKPGADNHSWVHGLRRVPGTGSTWIVHSVLAAPLFAEGDTQPIGVTGQGHTASRSHSYDLSRTYSRPF